MVVAAAAVAAPYYFCGVHNSVQSCTSMLCMVPPWMSVVICCIIPVCRSCDRASSGDDLLQVTFVHFYRVLYSWRCIMHVLLGRAAARGERSAIAGQAAPICHIIACSLPWPCFLSSFRVFDFRVANHRNFINDLRCSSPIVLRTWSGMQSSFIDRTILVRDV